MKDDVDMIVIDHLHYIQFSSASQEIEEIWKVMRQVKQITDTIKKPIVIMSHLRKRKKDADPTEQDLYWSSNIAKEANTILLVTRIETQNVEKIADGKIAMTDNLSWTKIIVEKSRTGLAVPSKFALLYDLDRKDYVAKSWNLITRESRASKEDFIVPKIWDTKS
jgi:3-phosphoglycerate kinase